jgi:hypothetical protein
LEIRRLLRKSTSNDIQNSPRMPELVISAVRPVIALPYLMGTLADLKPVPAIGSPGNIHFLSPNAAARMHQLVNRGRFD